MHCPNRLSRVQNATNTISWNFNQSDPAAVDIVVVNANNATLNGVFSIARFVNVTTQVCTTAHIPQPNSIY